MKEGLLQEALETIKTIEKAINYLEKNKIQIVEEAVSYIMKENKSYITKLKQNNNIKKFKESIIDGHIQWIIEDLYNPDEINFNKYNNLSLKNIPQAYCDVYTYLNESINQTNISKDIQEILQDYFNAFSNIYCY